MKHTWVAVTTIVILLSTPAKAAEDDLATRILRELVVLNTAPPCLSPT